MRCRIGLVAGLLLLGATYPCHADTPGPSAEDIKAAGEAFDLGKKAYKDKAWVDAAERFEEADARAPSAVALDLAIRARDKGKQLDRAATLAALALTRHPDQASLVKSARALIARAEKELYKLTVHCSPDCELVVGTKLVHGGAAKDRILFLVPGAGAAVHASWSGDRTRTAPVKSVKGGSGEISFEAPPEEKPPALPTTAPTATPTTTSSSAPTTRPPEQDRPAPSGGMSPTVFWVGAGLTVIAGGVTVWSGIDTLNNPGKDKVKTDCAGQGTECPTYQDGLSAQRRTNVLIGVTAGLGVVTGVIGAFFTDWSSGSPKKSAHIEPFVGIGNGATVGARGAF